MKSRHQLSLFSGPKPDPASYAQFAVELSVGADGQLPTEFCLFRAGENRTHDGRGSFLFDALSAQACETHHAERGLADYMVDFGHASLSFLAVDPAESGKAAGWFKMAIREGALWATDVSWTKTGAEKLRAREYRYFSPAADFEKTPEGKKRINKLINCALTNNPALAGIPPLVASTTSPAPPEKETSMKSILVLLGLAESATEPDALAALTKLLETQKALLAATAKATVSEALGVVQAGVAALAQVGQLSARIAEMDAAILSARVDGLVSKALEDGKLAPAQKDWALGLGKKDVVQLEAFLSSAPKLVQDPKKEKQDPPTVQLSAADGAVAKMLNVKPEDLAKVRAAGQ